MDLMMLQRSPHFFMRELLSGEGKGEKNENVERGIPCVVSLLQSSGLLFGKPKEWRRERVAAASCGTIIPQYPSPSLPH